MEATEALKAAQAAATGELRRLAEMKQQELEKRVEEAVNTREATFRTQMDARRRELVKEAEAQLAIHQEQYVRFVEAREKQLQTELTARRAERARLEASIMAEVRIEVATLAQEKGLDVVLARQYISVEGVDITEEVAHKVRGQQ
ncbi:MAG: hypothetical protein HY660_08800 [Armatimonadetes bacterium]|nr:hypothetical protein [Armatimonadota bacterium]